MTDMTSVGGIAKMFADRFAAIDREQKQEREDLKLQFTFLKQTVEQGDTATALEWIDMAIKRLEKD